MIVEVIYTYDFKENSLSYLGLHMRNYVWGTLNHVPPAQHLLFQGAPHRLSSNSKFDMNAGGFDSTNA